MPDLDLNVGDIFLVINLALSGENPHYHIVVHKTEDNRILVVHTTKEIEKVKIRCRNREKIKFDYIEPDTAIVINPSDSETFDIKCVIDCNKAQLKPISFFTSKYEFKIRSPLKDITIINKIKQGILKSPVIEEVVKKLLR